MVKPSLLPVLLLAAAATGGCNRSSDGGASQVAVATTLSYPSQAREYRVGVALRALRPTVDGAVERYELDPPPPAGIELDPSTGVLSGVPLAAAAAADYTVRARLAGGGVLAATVRFRVADDFDAVRFAYSFNLFPSSITGWRVDGTSGAYLAGGGIGLDGGPVRAQAHPLGDRLYVLDFDRGRVVTLAVDPFDGALAALDEDVTGEFPLALAVSHDGRFVHVGSAQDLRTFRVDPFDGTLALSRAPLPLPETSLVAVAPDGAAIALASTKFEAIGVFTVDPDDGGPSALLGFSPLRTPYAATFSEDGRRLFAASFADGDLFTFDADPPAPQLVELARLPVGEGTFSIEARDGLLWSAQFGERRLTVHELDGDALPETPAQVLPLAGTPTRVRADGDGGYAAPLFDLGLAQRADAPGSDPAFVPLRPFVSDLVLVPAPSGRSRTTPFTAALDAGTGTVSLLSAADGSLVAGPFTTGPSPRALSLDASGTVLAVGDALTGGVRRFALDAPAGALAAQGPASPAGFEVRDLVVDGGGRRLWALTDGQLVTIDLGGGVAVQVDQTPVGPSPRRVAVDPAGRFVAATDDVEDALRVFLVSPAGPEPQPALDAPVSVLDVGETSVGAGALAFDPLGLYLLVALEEAGGVRGFALQPTLGTATPSGTVFGLGRPVDLVIAPGGGRAIVADADGPALHLVAVDPRSVPFLLDTLPLAEAPRRLAVDGQADTVQVLDAAGTWRRVAFDGDELEELASAATGLVDPVDLVPVPVWADDAP